MEVKLLLYELKFFVLFFLYYVQLLLCIGTEYLSGFKGLYCGEL